MIVFYLGSDLRNALKSDSVEGKTALDEGGRATLAKVGFIQPTNGGEANAVRSKDALERRCSSTSTCCRQALTFMGLPRPANKDAAKDRPSSA